MAMGMKETNFLLKLLIQINRPGLTVLGLPRVQPDDTLLRVHPIPGQA
jgi:hypothetical protein